jgi:Flp pilus assembly protein TadB
MLVAAMLAALSAWLLVPASPNPRLRLLLQRPASVDIPQSTRQSTSRRTALMSAAVAGTGAYLLLGGVLGVVTAVACLVVIPRLLARLEPRRVREHRERCEGQAPVLADLLGALLASGATVRDALHAAAAAIPEPTATVLRPVVSAIDLGADPPSAWRTVGVIPAHTPIVDAICRAHESGAPAAGLLKSAADDIRRDRRREVEVAARSAGVRAVAPLAACFLPAFLLLGVVPVVASLASGLLTG